MLKGYDWLDDVFNIANLEIIIIIALFNNLRKHKNGIIQVTRRTQETREQETQGRHWTLNQGS